MTSEFTTLSLYCLRLWFIACRYIFVFHVVVALWIFVSCTVYVIILWTIYIVLLSVHFYAIRCPVIYFHISVIRNLYLTKRSGHIILSDLSIIAYLHMYIVYYVSLKWKSESAILFPIYFGGEVSDQPACSI